MEDKNFNFELTTDELALVSRCLHVALFTRSMILMDSEKILLVDLYRKFMPK